MFNIICGNDTIFFSFMSCFKELKIVNFSSIIMFKVNSKFMEEIRNAIWKKMLPGHLCDLITIF